MTEVLKEEATMSYEKKMAAAKEISVEAAVAAVLSGLDGIFERTKKQHWRRFSVVDNMFFFRFDSGSLWQEMR